ncbi:MAG: hypothetical protein ABIO39_14185 [Caulobacteraceae bacterium]
MDAAAWVDACASAIEHSAFAGTLRRSPNLYPAVNLGHLAGLVLLVGSIGVLDLRTLGAGRAVSLNALSRWLTPVAIGGLLLEIATGALLFAPDATALVHSKIFIAKMGLMVLGAANALLFVGLFGHPSEAPPLAKGMAALSLTIWLVVGGLGRILGYA